MFVPPIWVERLTYLIGILRILVLNVRFNVQRPALSARRCLTQALLGANLGLMTFYATRAALADTEGSTTHF